MELSVKSIKISPKSLAESLHKNKRLTRRKRLRVAPQGFYETPSQRFLRCVCLLARSAPGRSRAEPLRLRLVRPVT